MFDDIKQEDHTIAVGDPKKVEDVFNDIDPVPDQKSALQSGKLRPATGESTAGVPSAGEPVPTPGMQPPVGPPKPLTNLSQLEEWSAKRRSKRGWVLLLVIALLLIGIGVAAGAYIYLSQLAAPEDLTNQNENTNENTNENMNTTNEVPNTNRNAVVPPIPDEARIDADLDGLTDIEEQSLGTDPESIDTDSDGLSDRDEVRVHETNPLRSDSDNDGLTDRDELFVWFTDPKNTDTDADTYPDGEEVKNGFSPTGPGKLPVTDAITE